MELSVANRETLIALGEAVPNEFDNLIAKLTQGWLQQHTENDGHGHVTCLSDVNSGKLVTSGQQTVTLEFATYDNFRLDPNVSILAVNPVGNVSFTGFAGGTQGRRFVLVNGAASVDALILLLDGVTSAAENRISGDLSIGGDNIVIEPGRAVELIWVKTENVTSRWKAMVKV